MHKGKDMSFSAERDRFYGRAKRLLAEPVAWLLAAAYEPRQDSETCPTAFANQIKTAKRDLKYQLQDLTQASGGRIESIAENTARRLLKEADRLELRETASFLRAALSRCENAGSTSVNQSDRRPKVPEPERVLDGSGRPIGLWR
jgi:hypothetical protein